jgi:hypothetical protein
MRSVFPERPLLVSSSLHWLHVSDFNCLQLRRNRGELLPFTSPFYSLIARLALRYNVDDVTQENEIERKAFQSSTFGFLLSLRGVTVFTVNTQHSHADRNAINTHSGWIRFLTPRVMSRKRRRKSLRVIYDTGAAFGFKRMNSCQNGLENN